MNKLAQYLAINKGKWVHKSELIAKGIYLEETKGHDTCAKANTDRIKNNKDFYERTSDYYILLDNNKFKIAENKEEMLPYLLKDFNKAILQLKRYYGALKTLQLDGTYDLIKESFNEIFG